MAGCGWVGAPASSPVAPSTPASALGVCRLVTGLVKGRVAQEVLPRAPVTLGGRPDPSHLPPFCLYQKVSVLCALFLISKLKVPGWRTYWLNALLPLWSCVTLNKENGFHQYRQLNTSHSFQVSNISPQHVGSQQHQASIPGLLPLAVLFLPHEGGFRQGCFWLCLTLYFGDIWRVS